MHTHQDISIVLVTYNSETIIKNFLLQSQLQDHKNIITVDNANRDKTVSLIKKISYIHILQSNQYQLDSKPLSKKEKI